jgi:prepilin-type N-terminal cleavage/methylation domain-containing protein
MKKSKAFSLVELSVVLLVISLMSVGVLQGTSVIKQARIANARSITSTSPVPEIDGLVAWYETSLLSSFKTSEISQDSSISTWYDVNPRSLPSKRNALTRTASSSVFYETNGINKLPSIRITSESANFTLPVFYQGSIAVSTIFVVFNPYSQNFYNNMTLINSYSGSNPAGLNIGSDVVIWSLADGNGYAYNTTLDGFENYIVTGYLNGTSSKAFLNNATSGSTTQTSAAGTNPFNGLIVGSKNSTCCGFYGLLSEIIIYNRALNLQERKDVMRYLSKKYGIAVANL